MSYSVFHGSCTAEASYCSKGHGRPGTPPNCLRAVLSHTTALWSISDEAAKDLRFHCADTNGFPSGPRAGSLEALQIGLPAVIS
jgi:hypothetical protein